MFERYEINRNTLAIVPISKNKSKVCELESEFIINQSAISIIDNSCKFFGSSYMGRFEGTKSLVGYNYKSPIIIEETNKIIFFPTTSPRLEECIWLSLNNIKEYIKVENDTLITFNNNKQLLLKVSFVTIENQILRSTKLWCNIDKNYQIFINK